MSEPKVVKVRKRAKKAASAAKPRKSAWTAARRAAHGKKIRAARSRNAKFRRSGVGADAGISVLIRERVREEVDRVVREMLR